MDSPKKQAEAKFYSIIVDSNCEHQSGHLLHTGVYYSLEDAYSAAKAELRVLMGVGKDEEILAEMKIWEIVERDEIEKMFLHPEVPKEEVSGKLVAEILSDKKIDSNEIALTIKNNKQALMEKIIKEKDLKALNSYKNLFTSNEKKLLKDKILCLDSSKKTKR